MIDKFLSTVYVKGGRAGMGLDCYGLVRLARAELFGKPMLPLCSDAAPGELRSITRSCIAVAGSQGLHPAEAIPGAIATAWRASLCVHVGLVVMADGRPWILETDEPTGPCLTPTQDFERRYTRVIYYAD